MYVPLDVNFPDDDKIESVGFAAAGLYCQALCIAKRIMTDGRLTRVKLRKLGADDDLIDVCVRADLFRTLPDDPDGLQITAWLDHNESVSEIEGKRSKDAQRKRLTRAKRPAGQGEPSDGTPDGVRPLEVEVEVEGQVEVEAEPSTHLRTDPVAGGAALLARKANRVLAERYVDRRQEAGEPARHSVSAWIDSVEGSRWRELERSLVALASQHPDWSPEQIADATAKSAQEGVSQRELMAHADAVRLERQAQEPAFAAAAAIAPNGIAASRAAMRGPSDPEQGATQ